MATKLSKGITRESTILVDGKEVMVTLRADQHIELKLKGKRGEGSTISIFDLYNQLNKKSSGGPIVTKPINNKGRGGSKMISLNDLRSHNAISTMSLDMVSKFDQIIKSVMDDYSNL